MLAQKADTAFFFVGPFWGHTHSRAGMVPSRRAEPTTAPRLAPGAPRAGTSAAIWHRRRPIGDSRGRPGEAPPRCSDDAFERAERSHRRRWRVPHHRWRAPRPGGRARGLARGLRTRPSPRERPRVPSAAWGGNLRERDTGAAAFHGAACGPDPGRARGGMSTLRSTITDRWRRLGAIGDVQPAGEPQDTAHPADPFVGA